MKNKISGLLIEAGVNYNKQRLHKAGYFRELLATNPDIDDSLNEMKNFSPFLCFLLGLFVLLYGVDGFRLPLGPRTERHNPPRLPPTSNCNWGLFGLGRILGHPTRQNKGAQIGVQQKTAPPCTTTYFTGWCYNDGGLATKIGAGGARWRGKLAATGTPA